MPTPRVHIRAPGVKTGSTIGPLGPFRGTLGIHWVLGSIAARRIASGFVAATSSMSTPPSDEVIATYRFSVRSSVIAM